MEILRTEEIAKLAIRLESTPIVAIIGPRQCGKTTLANQFAREWIYSKTHVFDCENPRHLARLENPMLTLEPLNGLIIIDEIQRMPELFPVLRVIIDQHPQKRFLILGSASPELIFQSSETLAGRIGFHELGGFTISEVTSSDIRKLWVRGSFPRSFLAANEESASQWREDFIRTYLERDIAALGFQLPPITLRRFWTMLSHYHGQILNASEIGKSMNLGDKTVKRYLDILTGTLLVRQLHPWFYNTKKRLIKRPKIYFRDSGLFHSFLSVVSDQHLMMHPKMGASWEGFAMEQLIRVLNLKSEDVFFWGVHTGAELDLLFQKKGKMWGAEFKYQDAPRVTPSMRSAIEELGLNHLWVIYPGNDTFPMADNITVIGLNKITPILEREFS